MVSCRSLLSVLLIPSLMVVLGAPLFAEDQAPPQADDPLPPTGPTRVISTGHPPAAYTNRNGAGRKRCVATYGGNQASERAVEAGLRWLALHQSEAGAWDVDGHPEACPEAGAKVEPGSGLIGPEGDVLATAEAMLAFLSAGYDHSSPNLYKRMLRRSVDWLLSVQAADGSFCRHLTAHCRATQALAEAAGMAQDKALAEPLDRALGHLLRQRSVQEPRVWGMSPDRIDIADTLSATRCLLAAQAAGHDARQELAGARNWLAEAQAALPAGAPLPAGWGRDGTPLPTTAGSAGAAWALAVLLGLGTEQAPFHHSATATAAVEPALPPATPTAMACAGARSEVFLYLFHHGIDERWLTWNQRLRDSLTAQQVRDPGCFAGSWAMDASASSGEEDRIGRLLGTSRAIRCLQVYYNFPRWLRIS